jgi:alkylhydroperoxidase/carboxymuconolactone decarboxylase family protein YurZ
MSNMDMEAQEAFAQAADESFPVLETIFQMNLDSLPNCSLDAKTYHLVRLAALIAVNAPPASYLTHIPLAADAGVTIEDAQGVAVAIAPLVGSPRITAAAGNVLRALGLAAALEEG